MAASRLHATVPGETMSTFPTDHPASTPVTRVEILQHLLEAFTAAAVSRDDLVVEAERTGSRAEVIERLRGLPDRRFNRPQDLWADLPGVPIEN